MSSLSQLPEDIRNEFKFDADGKVYASFRAISKLCGVHESGGSVSNLLRKVALSESTSKALEPLLGTDYSALSVSGKGVPDTVVTLILQHFAFSGNETALKTLGALAAVGLRAYIQQELGWKPESNLPTDYRDALARLLQIEDDRLKVTASYPGLAETYKSCAKEALPVPELPREFLLTTWLAYKEIALTVKEKMSLGNFMASIVERDTHERLKRKHRNIYYNQSHLPLLDQGYAAWLHRGQL